MNKNKGFSLVELIVVVAIMAVLVGILAPAYLSYVEKTRRGADENAGEEIRHAVEIAAADICVYDELRDGCTLNYTNNCTIKTIGTANSAFTEAMGETFGDKTFTIKSKKYSGKKYVVSVSAQTATDAALTVVGCFTN